MRRNLIFCLTALFLISLCVFAYGKCKILNEKNPGGTVNIKDHLVPGKTNIIDFYADWCGPCKKIAPHLEELNDNKDNNVVVLKVNIKEWDSPVCKQYDINSVPSFMIYDGKGKLVSEGDEAYDKVINMINEE